MAPDVGDDGVDEAIDGVVADAGLEGLGERALLGGLGLLGGAAVADEPGELRADGDVLGEPVLQVLLSVDVEVAAAHGDHRADEVRAVLHAAPELPALPDDEVAGRRQVDVVALKADGVDGGARGGVGVVGGGDAPGGHVVPAGLEVLVDAVAHVLDVHFVGLVVQQNASWTVFYRALFFR